MELRNVAATPALAAAMSPDDASSTLDISERLPSERTDRGQSGAEPSGLRWPARAACAIIRQGSIPRHVAFIMDGNRRFARERGWNVAQGHRQGYDKLEEALRWCCELGIHGVTVYAFSIENFKRSAEEVAALMALTEEKLRAMSEEDNLVQRRGVRVRVVGDLSRVSPSLHAEMMRVMRMTQGNTKHTLTVCFSYTATNEIATAVRRLADACEHGQLLPADLNADLLERCLHTTSASLPPVDLIVRTSGERRLSDFLLWQSATCAVAFTKVLWPELSLIRFLGLLLRFQQSQPYLSTMTATKRKRSKSSSGGGSSSTSSSGSSSRNSSDSSSNFADASQRKRSSSSSAAATGARRMVRLLLRNLLPLLLFSSLALGLSGSVLTVMAATSQDEQQQQQQHSSQPRLLFSLASGCLGGWLLLAMLFTTGTVAQPPITDRAAAAAAAIAAKGGTVAAYSSTPLGGKPAAYSTAAVEAAGGGDDPHRAHRLRAFVAGLGVDRRV